MRKAFSPQYQNVILIFNLLLGDFVQSIGFGLDSVWLLRLKVVLGPVCDIQGTLIQTGDMVGSLFVMSIAVHTFTYLVLRKSVSKTVFCLWVTLLWAISLMTGIGLPLIFNAYQVRGDFYWTL